MNADHERRKHDSAVKQAVERTDALMAQMTDQIVRAVADLGDRPLKPSDLPKLMRQVDRALAAVYGPSRTDDCALGNLIAEQTERVRREAATTALQPFIRVLQNRDPATLTALEMAANDD